MCRLSCMLPCSLVVIKPFCAQMLGWSAIIWGEIHNIMGDKKDWAANSFEWKLIFYGRSNRHSGSNRESKNKVDRKSSLSEHSTAERKKSTGRSLQLADSYNMEKTGLHSPPLSEKRLFSSIFQITARSVVSLDMGLLGYHQERLCKELDEGKHLRVQYTQNQQWETFSLGVDFWHGSNKDWKA